MKEKTLRLYLEDTSKFGKHANRGRIIYEKTPYDKYGNDISKIDMSSFVYDCRVRDMVSAKRNIEELRCMPKIFYNNENVTSLFLPDFIKRLEHHFGDFKYTEKRTQRELGSIEYLEKNGVIINN